MPLVRPAGKLKWMSSAGGDGEGLDTSEALRRRPYPEHMSLNDSFPNEADTDSCDSVTPLEVQLNHSPHTSCHFNETTEHLKRVSQFLNTLK